MSIVAFVGMVKHREVIISYTGSPVSSNTHASGMHLQNASTAYFAHRRRRCESTAGARRESHRPPEIQREVCRP